MPSKQFFQKAISLLALGLLAACAHNPTLEELRHTAPKGTAFQNELAKLYLTYAEVAQEYGDYGSASLFAEKGLKAAYGNDILPEKPKNWKLEETALKNFARKRKRLMGLLSDELKTKEPIAAAGSVFFYDCMLDQFKHSPEGEELKYCRKQLHAMMGDLREARSRMVAEQSLEDATPPPAAKIERFLVYFALDRHQLNDAAKRTVELLYKELKEKTNTAIVVNGHTDTSGSDRYNMMLSNRRADSVKNMLVLLGLKPEDITTYGFGETDLAVPTDDNTFEPKNRRVEIVVN